MLYPKDSMWIEAMFSSNLSTDGTNAHEASEWQMKKGCVERFWELEGDDSVMTKLTKYWFMF